MFAPSDGLLAFEVPEAFICKDMFIKIECFKIPTERLFEKMQN